MLLELLLFLVVCLPYPAANYTRQPHPMEDQWQAKEKKKEILHRRVGKTEKG